MSTRFGTRLARLETALAPELDGRLIIRLGQRGSSPVARTPGAGTTVHLADVTDELRDVVPEFAFFDLTRDRSTGLVVMTSVLPPEGEYDDEPDTDPWVGELTAGIMAIGNPDQRRVMAEALDGPGWRVIAVMEGAR